VKRLLSLLAVSGLLLALLAAPASAAVAASGPGGFATGYVTPVVVVEKGEELTYFNFDVPEHYFVATDSFVPKRAERRSKWCSGFRSGKCPLFWTPTIGAGESTRVLGLSRVKPGARYGFFCSRHPNMQGTLIVR
jgi:plastocyanin